MRRGAHGCSWRNLPLYVDGSGAYGSFMKRLNSRVVAAVACGLLVAVAFAGVSPASAATKKKVVKKPVGPRAGGVCTVLNQNAPGTSLDCVRVGNALQWQPRGTKINPFRIGDVGSFSDAKPLPYRLRVTVEAKQIDPSEIKPEQAGRRPIPAGSIPVKFLVELTNLGTTAGDPLAQLVDFKLIDSLGKVRGFYGDQECEQFGTGLSDRLDLRALNPGANTGSLCAVIPSAQLDGKLLLEVIPSIVDSKVPQVWFRTSPV